MIDSFVTKERDILIRDMAFEKPRGRNEDRLQKRRRGLGPLLRTAGLTALAATSYAEQASGEISLVPKQNNPNSFFNKSRNR